MMALHPERLRWRAGLLSLFLVVSSAWGSSESDAWRTESNEEGVHVYSRAVEGSPVRAVKAEVVVESSFDGAVALLLDASQRPRWDQICAEASVIRQLSDTEDLVYVHNDLPWPVADRDMVLRREWSIDADRTHARIRAHAVDGELPDVSGRVRVAQADGLWTVEKIEASRVRITTEIHADPGGPIPSWLMNTLSVQGPHKALMAIRRLLESGEGVRDGFDPKAAAPEH